MLLYLLMSISLTLSTIFIFLDHPMSLGLILLLQTILMCLISGYISISFWFSYILLLIYLGGMLVLFMYVTSLASNEMFIYSNKFITIIIMIPLLFIIMYFSNMYYIMNSNESNENIMELTMYYSNNFLLKMYNKPINMITILIASYLFLTLIAVVKIIHIFKGPLRQLNN
uniref:NADH dehydrogenase subunit 6 n=1 Tax=Gonypeta brunneri TaxID=2909294 RepID=UPI003002DB79